MHQPWWPWRTHFLRRPRIMSTVTHAKQLSAKDLLSRLESTNRNTDFDWETLLEANYLTLLSDRANLGIVDIGGHAGRHSLVMKRQLNPVHLLIFEPLPEQHRKLRTIFEGQKGVVVYSCALGNATGQSDFVVKKGAPGESGLRQRSFYNDGRADDLEIIPVSVQTLDAINIPFQIHFIKIDTEGGEIDILKGAAHLLHRDAPIISVEYGPGGYDAYGYQPGSLFDLASEMRYSIFDLFGNRFSSRDEWMACVARFYWDFILIPDRKIPELADRLSQIRAFDPNGFLHSSSAAGKSQRSDYSPARTTRSWWQRIAGK
jgi:FkbM family methyltransferase